MSVVLSEHLPLLATAPNGIQELRGLILELAVRGKLVPQDSNDEPASELLKRIAQERARLEAEGICKKSKPTPIVNDDEQPFALPEGWEWTRLGTVSRNVQYGYTTSADHASKDVLFLRITDIQDDRVEWDSVPGCQIPNKDVSGYQLQRGDIVIARTGGTIGKSYLVEGLDRRAIFASYLIRVGYLNGTNARYSKVFLGSECYWSQLYANSMGTGQPNVNGTALSGLTFPLPPLAEQHRIVAKVDELMALCDHLETEQDDTEAARAKLVDILLGTLTQSADAADLAANWQRLAEHFDTLFTTESSFDALKQTILQLAIMGKLVPQDPNEEPASELLQRIVQERARLEGEGICKKLKALPPIGGGEQPYTLPVGWKWVRLGELSEQITSGSRDWAQHYSADGAIFVRMGNLSRGSYQLRLNNIQHVKAPSDGEGTRTRLQAGDLLLSITGEVGLLGLIPDGFGEAYINQHTCMIRTFSIMRGRFIPEVLRSPLALFQYNEPQRGIKNSFRLTDVAEIMIPLPPLAEQHRIVAKIDELMALCDRLKADLAESRSRQSSLASTLIESALKAA